MSEPKKARVIRYGPRGYVIKMPTDWSSDAAEYFFVEDDSRRQIVFTKRYISQDERSILGRGQIIHILSISVPALVAVLIGWILYSLNSILWRVFHTNPPWYIEWALKALLGVDLFALVWKALNDKFEEIRYSAIGKIVFAALAIPLRVASALVIRAVGPQDIPSTVFTHAVIDASYLAAKLRDCGIPDGQIEVIVTIVKSHPPAKPGME